MSYEAGKIYMIKCDDYFYYGSCITSLERRATTHRYRSKNITIKKYQTKLYNYINNKKWTIELIYNYPCNNKKELMIKEDEYIKPNLNNPFCLNGYCATWDKEKDSKRKKEWYEKNKERISIMRKEQCKLTPSIKNLK